MVTNSFYETKDIGEASYLFAVGQKVNSINKIGNICWFVFDDKQVAEELSTEFWFGSPLIDAKRYYEAIKTLKNRVFSQQ